MVVPPSGQGVNCGRRRSHSPRPAGPLCSRIRTGPVGYEEDLGLT